MARVTVEDCVDKVPNRFDLVMLASHRAREISPVQQSLLIVTMTKTLLYPCAKLLKKRRALMNCVSV